MQLASDFKPGERVIYVPMHAEGDITDPDCEHGAVSSTNDYVVFVKFDQHVKKFGWDGATSQACDPNDLFSITRLIGRTHPCNS